MAFSNVLAASICLCLSSAWGLVKKDLVSYMNHSRFGGRSVRCSMEADLLGGKGAMGGCCGVSSARSCPGSSSWSGVLVVMGGGSSSHAAGMG